MGICIVSVGYSSATLGIKTAMDSGHSAIVFTGATFEVYGNHIQLLNGTLYGFFSSPDCETRDLTEISVSYSKAAALLFSYLLNGGPIKFELIGKATFITPLGLAELPLNISTLTGFALRGPSSAGFEGTTAVTNDPSLAAFSGATFQVYANGIDLVNGTAHNSLPGVNTPPKVSTVTTELSFPYSKAKAFLWSYFLTAERVRLMVNGTVMFQAYITFGGEPVGEVDLPLKISTMTSSYGSLAADLDYLLIILAVVGILLYRKGYA